MKISFGAGTSQAALDEALRQLELLEAQENERRKGTDDKLGSLQGTIGVILTLVAGSVSLTAIQNQPTDVWRILTYVAFAAAIVFFVWAAQQIRKASDPRSFQSRTAKGILNLLESTPTKEELVLDGIRDYGSLIEANQKATNDKLTWYRAAIENIIKGVYCLAAVAAIFLVSLLWSAAHSGWISFQQACHK